MAATILKCTKCKEKYRIYPVEKVINGVKIKHHSYKLYKEVKRKSFWWDQLNFKGIDAKGIDYDKRGKVTCDCPKCSQLMIAV